MTKRCIVDFSLNKTVKISKWKVEEGNIVYDGRILLLYEEGDKTYKLKSKHVGTVCRLLVKEGDTIKSGDPLLELDKGCSHPTVINDLCAECGADLQKDGRTPSEATVPMVHSIPTLKVSHKQAQKLGLEDRNRLLKGKKLVLLVDLDQTLIHTTHDNIPNNLKDVYHFQLNAPGRPTTLWYHTRLRPGTNNFLQKMSKYFELHIITFGVRQYAHMIAHILDKDGRLFSNRILSRDECLSADKKHPNLKALFPSGDELVVIIDDREDVWNQSRNLIPVKPYVFFRNTGDIHDPNRMGGCPLQRSDSDYLAPGVKIKKKPEIKPDEVNDTKESDETTPKTESNHLTIEQQNQSNEIEVEEEDDYLIHLADILITIHNHFYEQYDKENVTDTIEVPDVKQVITDIRLNILKDCQLVFSGLVPLQTKLEESIPYNMALKLGARVLPTLCRSATHLVAAAKGTAKVHQAKKREDISIVNPHWLLVCFERWERVNEKLFDLNTDYGPLPPHFGRIIETRGVPTSLITLSQEDIDALAEEVDEASDSDSDDNKENKNGETESNSKKLNGLLLSSDSLGSGQLDQEGSSSGHVDMEMDELFSTSSSSSSSSENNYPDSSANGGSDDDDEDLSSLGLQIEKELEER